MELIPGPAAIVAPAAGRNREPILALLRGRLRGVVLEVASGSGEHAIWFAEAMPELTWQPTDRDPERVASIAAWREAAGLPNVRPPLLLDASATWPIEHADSVLAINMIHIAPWSATEGLMAGAGKVLPPGAPLVLYGPFRETDQPLAEGNAAFDADLKERDPDWGLRELDAVAALAARHGLTLEERIAMPANNLTVVFRRG